MKVRALRGVCVGIGRYLVKGEVADIDDENLRFLFAIGAVEEAHGDDAHGDAKPEKAIR